MSDSSYLQLDEVVLCLVLGVYYFENALDDCGRKCLFRESGDLQFVNAGCDSFLGPVLLAFRHSALH